MKKKKVRKVKRSTKAKVSSRKTAKEEYIDKPVFNAISVIITLAIALFIFVSMLGKCGSVGEFIKNALLSGFGTCSYFIPIIFVFTALLNIYRGKSSRIRNYAVIICFISLICILQLVINERPNDNEEMVEIITKYIDIAKSEYSFQPGHFSGGAIGVGIAESIAMFFSTNGSLIFMVALFIISLLIFTGLSIYGKILSAILLVITFIPRKISEMAVNEKMDDEIAVENEKIFNEVMESKIKPLKYKEESDDGEDPVYDPRKEGKGKRLEAFVPELKKEDRSYKTNNIDIDPSDIQKRFFNEQVSEEKRIGTQESLLKDMNTNSINQIFNDNKDVKPDDFFYENEVSEERKEQREIERQNGYIQTEKNNFTEENYGSSNKIFDEEPDAPIVEKVIIPDTNYQSRNDILSNNEKYVNDLEENRSRLSNALDDASMKQDLQDHRDDHIMSRDIESKNNTIVKRKVYKFPPIDILLKNRERNIFDKDATKDTANILKATLEQFGVGVVVTNVSIGPTVTRYELQPNLGVKVSKVLSLQDDIKLALAASDIRIEAPIPGKSAIGIEVPNKSKISVLLGDLIASREFKEQKSLLACALGKDISGKNIYMDLGKMPHTLIAGATGSGKSVCINTIIMSLIYKASPKDVRMILIDPKVVELQSYNDVPHLLTPVVTDPKKAKSALNWAVNEMSKRYKIFAEKQVKDIDGYNQLIDLENKNAIYEDSKEEHMPRIVIIIDELADLMMEAGKEVESSIVRLAQLSRACGIHLVIATQRPSVNVVTGLIKANVPSRIAFAVSSGVDSRTIIDMNGAEDLLGNGDMLYFPTGMPKPLRLQGCFVSEKEIKDVVNFVRDTEVERDDTIVREQIGEMGESGSSGYSDERDEMFYEAGVLCIETGQPSIGLLQRKFRMGFNRAARIIDQLEEAGVVSAQDGKKPRDAIMTLDEFNTQFGNPA